MLARPARILLADDHALVRSGLRMIEIVPATCCGIPASFAAFL